MRNIRRNEIQTKSAVRSIAASAVLIALTGFMLTSCNKIDAPGKITPYTIDSVSKAVISFEADIKPMAVTGVFFVSSPEIPSPPEDGAYSPVEIPVNAERAIRVRVVFDNSFIKTNDSIDIETDLILPPLAAGSYTIAFAYDENSGFLHAFLKEAIPLVGVIKSNFVNKRLELKDSAGNVFLMHRL